MSCTCETPTGNPVYNIPVKVGEPLSTACERVTTIGSIPSVIRYPQFTLVNGTAVATEISDGGIENMRSFFQTRNGCYQSMHARTMGSTCA